MDWFKHATGSHEDPDISDAWDTFGDSGPVIFWTILEVFGAEFSHLKDGWLTLSISYFERKTRRKFKKSEKILEFFQKRERIYYKKDQQEITLTIPKFIKIASNWTTRSKDIPTEAPTEAPTAKEEEEEKKKNIKEKHKRDDAPFILPKWIPSEIWIAYLDVRAKKRAAKTTNALNLVIQELEKIKDLHNHDPVEVLKKSIRSGWTDVYPLKDGNGNGQHARKELSHAGLAKSDGTPWPRPVEYGPD